MIEFDTRTILLGLLAALMLGVSAEVSAAEPAATYVGAAQCVGCHASAAASWRQSHHAFSMQPATLQTVLGDFAAGTVAGTGDVRLRREGDRFLANLEGPDGVRRDFVIRYTFGIYPLQQYLVDFTGGRLQVLGVTWDARPKAEGGQRWYSLYPDSPPKPGDPLHWSGRDQNWNFMCAACHSTGLRQNYDLAADRFASTWSDIDVACESCHGPGSRHVAWANAGADARAQSADKGLTTRLTAGNDLAWGFGSSDQAIATPSGEHAAAQRELDVCFPCHARRQSLRRQVEVGRHFLDNYLPSLIAPGLYQADGQIDGEVFEFGSFTQSKMFRAGVTCSNCHDPHRLTLRAPGNALCAQCHQPARYDRPEHSHHATGSSGSACVDCHMPAKTYMGVDRRRDHGFRIPRPDLSESDGAPNVCTQCHTDKTSRWASDAIASWTGKTPDVDSHPATAIMAAWQSSPATERRLEALLANPGSSGILRATALSLLPVPPSSAIKAQVSAAVLDADPLVRLGAARALAGFEGAEAVALGGRLLTDTTLAVRIEAARALVGLPEAAADAAVRQALAKAVDELIAAELASAERPESHVNLAQIQLRLGRVGEATRELETALRLDPRFVPAMVNLADLYRTTHEDAQGEVWLQRAIATDPGQAGATHALGLLRIRQGRLADALALLRQATEIEPGSARYASVYAIALLETGQAAASLSVVNKALLASPNDSGLLQTRIAVEQALGMQELARRHTAEFEQLTAVGVKDLEREQ